MSPEQALRAAKTYVRENLPGFTVGGLLQDADDYHVLLKSDSDQVMIGPEFVFINKATQVVYTTAPAGPAVRKRSEMTPV